MIEEVKTITEALLERKLIEIEKGIKSEFEPIHSKIGEFGKFSDELFFLRK